DLKAATARKRAEMEALYGPFEPDDTPTTETKAANAAPEVDEAPLKVEHTLPERTGDKPLTKEEIDLLNKTGPEVVYPPVEKAAETKPAESAEELRPAGPEKPPATEDEEPEDEEPEEE
ncbi:hypothetical protein HZA57_09865, partial [Candidatus Poribacteria bacterium]|nr:hypothetical protein [Candidatus Poribacteria bacterium]